MTFVNSIHSVLVLFFAQETKLSTCPWIIIVVVIMVCEYASAGKDDIQSSGIVMIFYMAIAQEKSTNLSVAYKILV